MFQRKSEETIKIHILCLIIFFPEICRLRDIAENVVEPDRQYDSMAHALFVLAN